MIGNDLVDLAEAARASNWKRKGYLDKLFTTAEIEVINRAERQEQYIWLLWTMKEAAYKIDSRISGIRRFAPSTLACADVQITPFGASGMVIVDQRTYFTSSDLSETYIHTVAARSSAELPLIKKEIYINPSSSFGYKRRKPLCVSHHGKYLALVF